MSRQSVSRRCGTAAAVFALLLAAQLLTALPAAASSAASKGGATAGAAPALSLQQALAREIEAARKSSRAFGVHIVDLSSHQSAFAVDADQPRILASNTKLLTTAAALGTLGADFVFETRVMVRGTAADGVLAGDLAVFGSGDPNLSGRFHDGDSYAIFRAWAAALKAQGIHRVSGDLFLVNGLFNPPNIHPDWPRDQLTSWYEAPVEALSFNDNCVLVRVWPASRAGLPARVETVPKLDYFEIRNSATTTGTRNRNRLLVGRLGDSDTIVVSGTIGLRTGPGEEWVAVQNPTAYFGASLKAALAEEGVVVDGAIVPAHGSPGGAWELVTTHRSDLARTLEVTNKRSQNFYAESLAKLLGWKVRGEGSWAAGVGVVGDFLSGLGIAPGSFSLADGSGLSRGNLMSPRSMTGLLEQMYFHALGRDFLRSLPFSGEQGLKWQRRLARAPYAGNVFAKTGTINGVSTLSGYAKAVSGKVYAFSILFNQVRSNAGAHAAQDRIVAALIDRG
ncbi:MAG: D-alanyl-D-alanine carboxypeptidase/D-alanyl-D-alanine-endopeptidase [Acidobacteriota bacterium]|nr:D-alanyl-D-alanine carboxypeptidase/D-alanyl-D-alanine-endopeptidase [Acidobacteriota bacterium]